MWELQEEEGDIQQRETEKGMWEDILTPGG